MTYIANQVIEAEQITIKNHFKDLGIDNIRVEIIEGLTSKQKYLSSKFFYNEKGSKLFEEITQLPEYYPTRTEKSILNKVAPDLMSSIKNTDIVELGSGDCSKISILLNEINPDNLEGINYIPVDVSMSAIKNSAHELVKRFPDLTIHGLVADFIHQIDLIPAINKRMFCFLGSTLGNFDENIAADFLQNLSSNMKVGDTFLLGLDLVKPIEILHNAYNDKQNITAKFNKNILSVVNEIIESDFNQNDFEHLAFFNENQSRMEMHLVAKKDICINTPYLETGIQFKKGEDIYTENSYKYTLKKIRDIEKITNLSIKNIYTDSNNWFSLILLQKK